MRDNTKVISKRKYQKMSPKQRRLLWWKINYKKIVGIVIATAALVAIVVGIIINIEPKGDSSSRQLSYTRNNIVYIGSTSCEPCKLLTPVVDSIASEYSNQIKVTFYDAWNTTLGAKKANEFNVPTLPTLIFIDSNGNELHRLQGYQSYDIVIANLQTLGWI